MLMEPNNTYLREQTYHWTSLKKNTDEHFLWAENKFGEIIHCTHTISLLLQNNKKKNVYLITLIILLHPHKMDLDHLVPFIISFSLLHKFDLFKRDGRKRWSKYFQYIKLYQNWKNSIVYMKKWWKVFG